MQDILYASRVLRNNPGFTTVAVLTLALGIGANTALFSVVNAVLLRPLAYRDPARLVQLWESSRDSREIRVSGLNFLDWRAQSRSFEAMALYADAGRVTAAGGDLPQRTTAAEVSRDFFAVFGVSAALGRTFIPEEHRPGEVAAVMGYGLWQRAFGKDPKTVGKTIHISGIACHVVGIAPPGFQYPGGTELWIPVEVFPDDSTRSAHNYAVVGRLKPGMRIASAQAELDTIARRLEQQYPESNRDHGVSMVSLQQQLVGNVKSALLILLGAVGFVLLIACGNVANLLLARSAARSREMAVRAALGAGRGRLMRQVLVESLLLSGLGGALGLLLAVWLMSFLSTLIPAGIPRANEIAIDSSVLWFTLVISAFTGLLFGLLPAIRGSRADLNDSLKRAGRPGTPRARQAGNILVISELALSMMLLVAAGLFVRSFLRILQVDPGFRAEHVLTAQISLPFFSTNGSFQAEPARRFYQELLERIPTLPGVVAAGTTTQLPLAAGDNTDGIFDIEGRPPAGINSAQDAGYRVVSPDYFRAMGIPIAHGRSLNPSDSGNSARVALINQSMARAFWPGEDSVGKRIKFQGMEANEQWTTIVGVVGDVREQLTRASQPAVFVPLAQHFNGRLAEPNLVIRATGDPRLLLSEMRGVIRTMNKDVPVEFGTMDALMADSVAQQRFQMRLLALLAGLALTLAAVGIYGVISYSASRRTREIGIRMALGAERYDVMRMVMAEGAGMAAAGIGLGVAGAAALSRILVSQLYEVSATDASTYIVVALLLLFVALAATYIPARRATTVDPMIALRYE